MSKLVQLFECQGQNSWSLLHRIDLIILWRRNNFFHLIVTMYRRFCKDMDI